MPLFLYGQGVTGCIEAISYSEGQVTSLRRLFMRSGSVSDWIFTSPAGLSRLGPRFDESSFFSLILALLP